MDVKYINPFITAVKKLFNTMIEVPFKLGKPSLKKGNVPEYEISSIIGLSGTVTGCVVINLSKEIALQLVSALIGDEVTELDDDCTDAIGEIANMIAGNAKTDFPIGRHHHQRAQRGGGQAQSLLPVRSADHFHSHA
jgi:chemotaxis protein CheX